MSDQDVATPTPSASETTSNNNGNNNGKAGKATNYAQWSQITTNLINETEKEEKQEQIASTAALGLDGKHPYSQSEANERQKATEVAKTKHILDGYKKREVENVEVLSGLLGPVVADDDDGQRGRGKETGGETKYVTRDSLSAGKRVLTITDTSGPGHIVLTQDLTHLVCNVPVNATLKPKSYPNDAENELKEQSNNKKTRTVHGLIKLNLTNIHNATIIIRCKVITATMEITRCTDLTVCIEKEATIATIQCDLCQNLTIEFHDAPSGKNVPHPNGATTTVFWGDDKDDRIYHAGVTNLNVQTYRDGYIDLETCNVSYKALGAIAVGNASPEEMQFVTSVVNGELITERVVRDGAGNASSSASGGGGGGGARAMTEREMEEVKKRKEQIRKAVDEKLGSGIRFEQKKGGKQEGAAGVGAEEKESKEDQKTKSEGEKEAVEEELYASMSQTQIDSIISECDAQKQKGNDAFTSGEYAQAVLYYTLALDKTAELPDSSDVESRQKDESSNTKEEEPLEQLYPRHILLSNRSACFLKLGHHDKALCDATFATQLNPNYVKGVFRKGLALHAMGKYSEAVPVLGVAHRIEPKNKQIGQALQFAEVRLEKERRERGG